MVKFNHFFRFQKTIQNLTNFDKKQKRERLKTMNDQKMYAKKALQQIQFVC